MQATTRMNGNDRIESDEEPSTAMVRTTSAVPMMTFAELDRMAEAVAKGGLFTCRTKDAALTLLLLAQAEGVHPIQAMRMFHIIENRPTLRADAMQAKYQQAGGRIKWIKRTDEEVSAEFWDETFHPEHIVVTWDDARLERAGLFKLDKHGNVGNHEKYPTQMKAARVISEGVRAIRPEIVVGLYTPEEMQGLDEPQQRPKKQSPHGPANVQVVPTDAAKETEYWRDADGEPDLSHNPTFYAEWDKAIVSRQISGLTVKLGNGLLGAAITRAGEEAVKLDWRHRMIDKLIKGEFDELLKKKVSPPQTEPAKTTEGKPATAETTKVEAKVVPPVQSEPKIDTRDTQADPISITPEDINTPDKFMAEMCEIPAISAKYGVEEVRTAVNRNLAVIKKTIDTAPPAALWRIYVAAKEGRFAIPGGQIRQPQPVASKSDDDPGF